MTKAVIVVGNERRFQDDALSLFFHLEDKLGIRPRLIRAAYLDANALWRKLETFMRQAVDEPILLAYNGHGLKDGWYPFGGGEGFPYGWLAEMLAKRTEPTMVLNDCCHAGELIPVLGYSGVSPKRCGIIAACETEDVSWSGMTGRVLEAWSQGALFVPNVGQAASHDVELVPHAQGYRYLPVRIRDRAIERISRWLHRHWPKRFKRVLNVRLEYDGIESMRRLTDGTARLTSRVSERRWGAELDYLFYDPDAPCD